MKMTQKEVVSYIQENFRKSTAEGLLEISEDEAKKYSEFCFQQTSGDKLSRREIQEILIMEYYGMGLWFGK